MDSDTLKAQSEYAPPRNETERMIGQMWEKVLKLERVGIHDNFVDLGGDSLHAMRVMKDIHSTWSIEVSIEQLFEHETIESLAQLVDQLKDRSPAI